MTNIARNELRAALARRTAAESAFELAQAATDRARALLEQIVREGEDREAADKRISSTLAADMKAALLASAVLPVAASDKEMAKSAAARATMDARRQAAEQVVTELVADERDCERELSAAKAGVEKAVQDVMLGEAEAIARAWAEADLKARAIRVRLGGLSGDAVWSLSGFSTTVGKALHQNRADREFDSPEGGVVRESWTAFSTELLKNPDAQWDFSATDHALQRLRDERAAFLERYAPPQGKVA
jgi:hypothetical protein